MLQKIILGNLGNQMFQYASLRGIQAALYPDEPIRLIFTDYQNQLLDFNLRPYQTAERLRQSPLQRLLSGGTGFLIERGWKSDDIPHQRAVQHRVELRMQPVLNRFGLYQMQDGYYPFAPSKAKNKIVTGYLESEQYFSHIAADIRREFTPIHAPLAENAALYERMAETEAVCVSVRRGDFLDPKIKNYAYLCDVNYYHAAIGRMKALVPGAVFFVFSDDVAWAREKLSFGGAEAHYERGTDPVYEKLRLMQSCKHFILSNSSFSWWAQYLSEHSEKRVIAPSRWRRGSDRPDIYQAGWNLIDV